jgi:hypothetical protein
MKMVLLGLSQLTDKYIVKRLRLLMLLQPKKAGKTACSSRQNHFITL